MSNPTQKPGRSSIDIAASGDMVDSRLRVGRKCRKLSLLSRLLVVIPSMQQPQRPSAPFSAGPTESVGSFGIGLAGGGASGAAGGVPVYGSVGGGGSVGFPAPAPLTVVTGESLSVFAGWVGATVECCGLCNCCNER